MPRNAARPSRGGIRRLLSVAVRPVRVIVVEDNAALRLFVGAALQDLNIELVVCAGATEALQALASGSGARLVLTDLVLHRESGLALIEQLTLAPELHKVARVAVFSASVDSLMQQRLAGLGVRHILRKPVSVGELQAFVLKALADSTPGDAHDAQIVTPESKEGADGNAETQVIDRFFAGDATLHAEFKAACMVQFHDDALNGDAACQVGDAHALRRLAHSLETVLDTLGHGAMAKLAHDLQGQAVQGDLLHARATWLSVRTGLLQLANRQNGPA